MQRRLLVSCGLSLLVVLLAGGAEPAAGQSQDQFFDDAVLQDVQVTMSSRDWSTLKATFLEDTYYPAAITWRGVTVRNVGVRSRGTGTRNGVKPSLHVDVNRYVANQLFLSLRAFELKNMYADPSLIRETVAMKIYANLGIPVPREAHARLFVNGEYQGIYVIVESVDRTFIENRFGPFEGAVEVGGYLYEYTWRFPYGFEDLGTELAPYALLFQPQTRQTDAIVKLYDPIEAWIRAINGSTAESFTASVGAELDLTELMKYLAAELFTVEWDGLTGNWGANNFYLYRFRQTNRRPVLVPWDRDHAFTWDGVNASDYVHAPILLRVETSVLASRAIADPGLHKLFINALMECARFIGAPSADDPRGWLEREIDREAGQIATALAADPGFPFGRERFEQELEFLRAWARDRGAVAACQVQALEAMATCQ